MVDLCHDANDLCFILLPSDYRRKLRRSVRFVWERLAGDCLKLAVSSHAL